MFISLLNEVYRWVGSGLLLAKCLSHFHPLVRCQITNATLSCSYVEKIGFSGGDQAQVFHRDPPDRGSNISSLPVGAEWGYAEGEEHARAEVKTNEGNLATSVINKPLMRA